LTSYWDGAPGAIIYNSTGSSQFITRSFLHCTHYRSSPYLTFFYTETQLARPIWTATRQTCDTDRYRFRHILLEIYLFLFETAREKSSKLSFPRLLVEHDRTSLIRWKEKLSNNFIFYPDQHAAAGMDIWGASPKCRNDLTVGIDSDTAASTLLNASSLVKQTSYSYSILTACRNRVRKSHGVSRIASTLIWLIILLCFCSPCAAGTPNDSDEQATQALTNTENVLLFDRSAPPQPIMQQIFKRAATTSSSASSASTASAAPSDALPRSFDAGLGNNFTTDSCPAFFKKFLSDDAFNECAPLSLLLQVSFDHSPNLHES
jgi:hypothetical protein